MSSFPAEAIYVATIFGRHVAKEHLVLSVDIGPDTPHLFLLPALEVFGNRLVIAHNDTTIPVHYVVDPSRNGVQARAEFIAKEPSLKADSLVLIKTWPILRQLGFQTSKRRVEVGERRRAAGQNTSYERLVIPDESLQGAIH